MKAFIGLSGAFLLNFSFIYEIFQKAHVTYDTKTAIVEAMEQITGFLTGSKYSIFNLNDVNDIIC